MGGALGGNLLRSGARWQDFRGGKPWRAHVDFGAERQRDGTVLVVEFKADSLALAQHSKHGSGEGTWRDVVDLEITVAHHHAVLR